MRFSAYPHNQNNLNLYNKEELRASPFNTEWASKFIFVQKFTPIS